MKIQISQRFKILSAVLGSALACSVGMAGNVTFDLTWQNNDQTGVITNSYTNFVWTNGNYCSQNPAATILTSVNAQHGYAGNSAWGGGTALVVDTGMQSPGSPDGTGAFRFDCVVTGYGREGDMVMAIHNWWSTDGNTTFPITTGITEEGFWIYMSNSPGISLSGSGDCGRIVFTPTDSGFSHCSGTELTIPAAALGGWVKMTNTGVLTDINAMIGSGITSSPGLAFEYDNWGDFVQYQGTSGSSGIYPFTNTFWVASPYVFRPAVAPPVPRPNLAISKAAPGLNIFSTVGAIYGGPRETLQTPTPDNLLNGQDMTWIGASGPVSYSFTISQWNVPANDTISAITYFIPNATANDAGGDYSESNVIAMALSSTPTGVSWNFNEKANAPNCYCATNLVSLPATTAIGTWTVTFNNDTNVTMTGPGVSTNFTIADTNLATELNSTNNSGAFSEGMSIWFGMQLGNTGGQSANDHIVISEFKTSGTANDIDDVFTADNGVLDSSIWTNRASFYTCIQMLTPGNPYLAEWNQTAAGFQLTASASLGASAQWLPVTANAPFVASTNYWQFINTSDLPAGKTAFFAVILPSYSQLQVLLPGETAAPGTTTGKTGTPSNAGVGSPLYVTVNAVDNHFYPLTTVTNVVQLTSSDSTATTQFGQMSGGTVQIPFQFDAPGTWTITATDTNQPSMVGTSASVSAF